MDSSARPHFFLSLIGTADRHNLASTFLEAAVKFYEDPKNVKRYEAWKRERQIPCSTAAGMRCAAVLRFMQDNSIQTIADYEESLIKL